MRFKTSGDPNHTAIKRISLRAQNSFRELVTLLHQIIKCGDLLTMSIIFLNGVSQEYILITSIPIMISFISLTLSSDFSAVPFR